MKKLTSCYLDKWNYTSLCPIKPGYSALPIDSVIRLSVACNQEIPHNILTLWELGTSIESPPKQYYTSQRGGSKECNLSRCFQKNH